MTSVCAFTSDRECPTHTNIPYLLGHILVLMSNVNTARVKLSHYSWINQSSDKGTHYMAVYPSIALKSLAIHCHTQWLTVACSSLTTDINQFTGTRQVKKCTADRFILDNNFRVSWWIFTLLVPTETGINTLQRSVLNQLITVRHNRSDFWSLMNFSSTW